VTQRLYGTVMRTQDVIDGLEGAPGASDSQPVAATAVP